MFQNPLLEKIAHRLVSGPCISVIIPADPLAPGRVIRSTQVVNAVKRAVDSLQRVLSPADAKSLGTALDSLVSGLELPLAAEGLGLFASTQTKEAVPFYVPVQEAIVVDKRFLVRPLLYQDPYAAPYLALLLSGKDARLFRGRLCQLIAVNNDRFPVLFEDDYEYSKPARSASASGYAVIKDVERDKSQMVDMRYQAFLKKVDNVLHVEDAARQPLILAGAEAVVAQFKALSRHPVAATVPVNLAHTALNRVSSLAWEQNKALVDRDKTKSLLELNELPRSRVVTGLSEIWKAVAEGKGLRLFVERDFETPAYYSEADQYLYSTPPFEGKYETVTNAVDELMQLVIEKGGEVLQVDNDKLETYHRIALVTRY